MSGKWDREIVPGLTLEVSRLPGRTPLMNLLQRGVPKAQFMVCGVLSPKSNAHAPNEFLHVPYGKRLTAAVAQTIAALPARS